MTMKSPPTLRDVAQLAGVSSAIASRVLNLDPKVRVREDTRRRVQEAAEELGYVPHSLARSLRGARTGAIGLVMHGLDSPINIHVLEGAHSRCAQSGFVTLLAEAEDLAQDDDQLGVFLARGRLDGVILHSGYGAEDRLVEAISRTVPAVLVNADGGRDVPTVRVDDAAAAELATAHLLGLGHEDITFLAGAAGSESSARRESGYLSALTSADLAESADMVDAGWWTDSGARAIDALLARPRLPTGIVVANAVAATGALSALRSAGVHVPREISVVTIHDSWFLDHLSVPLTAVRLPLHALGSAAATLLIDSLNGEDVPQDAFISEPGPELVLRESTGQPRT